MSDEFAILDHTASLLRGEHEGDSDLRSPSNGSSISSSQQQIQRGLITSFDRIRWNAELEQSEEFSRLTNDQRDQIFRIVAVAVSDGASAETEVLDQIRSLLDQRVGTERCILLREDRRSSNGLGGDVTLDILERIAVEPLSPEFTGTPSELLQDLLLDITQSVTINGVGTAATEVTQLKEDPTCVHNSGDLGLAITNPVEYVRQVADLVQYGRSTVRFRHEGNGEALQIHFGDETKLVGDTIFLDPDAVERAREKGFSLTAAIRQTAFMKYVDAVSTGTFQGQGEALLEAQFGRAFHRMDANRGGNSCAESMEALRATKSVENDHIAVASIEWDRGGMHENHAVLVLSVRDGKVYFQNPWSSEYSNPSSIKAITVNKSARVYWMKEDDFAELLNCAWMTGEGAQFGLTEGYDDQTVTLHTRFFGFEYWRPTETRVHKPQRQIQGTEVSIHMKTRKQGNGAQTEPVEVRTKRLDKTPSVHEKRPGLRSLRRRKEPLGEDEFESDLV